MSLSFIIYRLNLETPNHLIVLLSKTRSDTPYSRLKLFCACNVYIIPCYFPLQICVDCICSSLH